VSFAAITLCVVSQRVFVVVGVYFVIDSVRKLFGYTLVCREKEPECCPPLELIRESKVVRGAQWNVETFRSPRCFLSDCLSLNKARLDVDLHIYLISWIEFHIYGKVKEAAWTSEM
jgi:hypothetical protein